MSDYITKTGHREGGELARLGAENEALAEALRKSESRFSLFMDNIPDPCILLDADFHYLYGNRAANSLPGHEGSIRGGEPIPLLEPGNDPAGRIGLYREVLASGLPLTTETEIPCVGSGPRRFRVRAFKAGRDLGLIGTDITDYRRNEDKLSAAEAELRLLAHHIIDVREEERKSVARELHDELGQALTAIEMELRCLARSQEGRGAGERERIGELLFSTSQSIRTVQRLCSELRPAVLDKLGLRAAIEWLAEDFSARCRLRAAARVEIREESIGPKASIALFRIAQETITNVVRHAQASSAEISLVDTGQAVELSVRDDGIGISAAQASAPGSFGIQGIKERALGLGGRAAIRGDPGVGTLLEVTLPYPACGKLP